jgi:hypothetical protein
MKMSGQFHALDALLPQERAPSSHWIGGWVGPRASLDTEEKRKISTLSLTGIEPSFPACRLVTTLSEVPLVKSVKHVDRSCQS